MITEQELIQLAFEIAMHKKQFSNSPHTLNLEKVLYLSATSLNLPESKIKYLLELSDVKTYH